MCLRETWKVFYDSNEELVGYSNLVKLPPENVPLIEETPKDQRNHITHESFRLKVEAIYKALSFWSLKFS